MGREGGVRLSRVRGVLVREAGELDEVDGAIVLANGGVGHEGDLGVLADVEGWGDILQAGLRLDATGAEVDLASTDGGQDRRIAVIVPSDSADLVSHAGRAGDGVSDVDGGRHTREERHSGDEESRGAHYD